MATTPRTALLDSATAAVHAGRLSGSQAGRDRNAYESYMRRQEEMQRQQYEDWKKSQEQDTSWGNAFKQGLGGAIKGALPGLVTLNPAMAIGGASIGGAAGFAGGKGWIDPSVAPYAGMAGAMAGRALGGQSAGAFQPATQSGMVGGDYSQFQESFNPGIYEQYGQGGGRY